MAEGHDYFAMGGMGVSDDNNLVAFGVDTVSRRQYTVIQGPFHRRDAGG